VPYGRALPAGRQCSVRGDLARSGGSGAHAQGSPPVLRQRRMPRCRDGSAESGTPLPLITGEEPSPHGQVEARAVLETLRKVHPRERAVLVLVGTGETVTEVARLLGVPVGTTFSRLRRGRHRVATTLARLRRVH
jgi:DNA-directed RNA polymerase specialized sigma24 family protein